jgi:hypothetical protein
MAWKQIKQVAKKVKLLFIHIESDKNLASVEVVILFHTNMETISSLPCSFSQLSPLVFHCKYHSLNIPFLGKPYWVHYA